SLADINGRNVVDPYSKVDNKGECGCVSLEGSMVDLPSLPWQAAMQSGEGNNSTALEDLGSGVVVEDEKIIAETSVTPHSVPWILTSLWLLSPAIAGLAYAGVLRNERRSNPTKI